MERIPTDKFEWRPHPKSMSLKHLASHVANLSEWPGFIVKTQYLDFANTDLKPPIVNSTDDLIQNLKKGTEESITALKNAKEEDLNQNWVLRHGNHVILDLPRASVIRRMGLSHVYHHRAQLGVYLRLLDIAVPGMYGPSADDIAAMKD